MNAIINFFVGFVDVITSVVNFVIDLVGDLLYVIALLAKFVIEIPSYFMWLPEEIIALLVALFGIVVIYMILNRK